MKRRIVIASVQEISIDSVKVIDDANPSTQASEMKSDVPFSEQMEVIKSKGIKLDQNSLKEEE